MNVAVLGLGIIGETWAENLRVDGLNVRAWNRTPKDVPGAVASVAEAVDSAEFIFVVVSDPDAVASVLDAATPTLGAGQTIIQSSTIARSDTERFAAQVEKTGAKFLEAPFTGSKPASQARQVVYYLGGDTALMDEAEPVLARLSKARLRIGELGSASALKLAMNLQIAGVAFALCEGLHLARASGVSDEAFFGALELNAARSGVSDLKTPKLREADYSPQFSLKHMGKDLRLAVESATELSAELPHTANLRALYDAGIAQGWGDDDFIGLFRLLSRD